MIPSPAPPPYAPAFDDPHFRRARRLAALFLAVVNALWVVAFVGLAARGGPDFSLTFPLGVMALGGLMVIVSRSRVAGDVALALMDQLAGMPNSPPWTEIYRRAATGLAVPLALLAVGFAVREDLGLVLLVLGIIVGLVLVFDALGYGAWQKQVLPPEFLRALLTGQLAEALAHFRRAPAWAPVLTEIGALGLATAALQAHRPDVMADVLAALDGRAAESPAIERAIAVVRADLARLNDPAVVAPAEAAALRLLPVGHPRRLSLAMFVATAALDQDDAASAIKALAMLHGRDLPHSPSRAVVNCLMLAAAEKLGDEALAGQCRAQLARFPLGRMAATIDVAQLGEAGDPYARWMTRAVAMMRDHNLQRRN